MTPILRIENNILESFKPLFTGEKFETPGKEKKELEFHKGFLPFESYKEKIQNGKDKNSDIPFILLRYKEDEQELINGRYSAQAVWEIIIGTYKESSDGYSTGLYIADKLKKHLMEYPNVPRQFNVKQDYIKTKLLEAESSGYYWFHKLEFKTYAPYYDCKIPL